MAVLLLFTAQIVQMKYNYSTANEFSKVQIYWYEQDNVMLVQDGNYTILVDMDTGNKLVSYETKNIVVEKEPFNWLKGKNDYTAKITFTQEFLNEL